MPKELSDLELPNVELPNVELPEEGNQPQEETQEDVYTEDTTTVDNEPEVEAEEKETVETEEEPAKRKIVWNGQELELTEEEIQELAQKGFDYTKKTQTLAEQRKAVELLLDKALQDKEVADKLLSDEEVLQAIENVPDLKEKLEEVRINRFMNEEPPDPIIDPEGYEKFLKEKAKIELMQELKQQEEQKRLMEAQQKFQQIEAELEKDKALYTALENKLNNLPDNHPIKLGLAIAYQTGQVDAIENFINEVRKEINSTKRSETKAPEPINPVNTADEGAGEGSIDEFYKFMLGKT